jgi:hypothetical protein
MFIKISGGLDEIILSAISRNLMQLQIIFLFFLCVSDSSRG